MYIEEKITELYGHLQEMRSKMEQLTEITAEKSVMNAKDVAEYTGFKPATAAKIMREAGSSIVKGKRFVKRDVLESYLMNSPEQSARELKQAAKLHLMNLRRKSA